MSKNAARVCSLCLLVVLLLPAACVSAQTDTPPMGYVIVPAISLYRPVYPVSIITDPDGFRHYDDADLVRHVGHLDGTSWIHDGWGVVALAGHSGGVFANVDELQIGDRVIMVDERGAVEYVITGRVLTTPDDTSWLMPTDAPTLVLIVCADWTPDNDRLIITAAVLP